MKIGIAGPITLDLLNFEFPKEEIPKGFTFPLISFIANGLAELGHELVIYTSSFGIKSPKIYHQPNTTICVVPRFNQAGRRFFKQEISSLTNLMQEYKVDIINVQWSYEFAHAAIASGVPAVITLRDHASTILKYERTPYTMVRWLMNYQTINRGKHFITNSEYLYSLFSAKKQAKMRIIPNFFKKGLETLHNAESSKEHYIISIANQSPKRKNLVRGLEAFAQLRKTLPDLEYYLVGLGTGEGEDFHNYAIKKGIAAGVKFMGRQSFEDTMLLIKNAKVLLHPSLEETFGNVILEAMVLGTPVVGGKKSGNVPYLLKFGEIGKVCNVNSASEIAQNTLELLQRTEQSRLLCQKARAYALDNFKQDKILTSLIEYYTYILENR